MHDFTNIPITRTILPHTNRLDGDDTGFRSVDLSPFDKIDPDPLVLINKRVKCYPRNRNLARNNFEPIICDGTVKDERMFLREPAIRSIEEVNQLLVPYKRELVLVGAFRHVQSQALVFSDALYRWLGERKYPTLTVIEQIQLGRKANEAALYVNILQDHLYQIEKEKIKTSDRFDQIITAAENLKIDIDELILELFTYETNLGFLQLNLDKIASTAHGNGGAVDAWVIHSTTGKFVNRGVPAAYNHAPAVMDYFEWATPEMYEAERKKSFVLDSYLRGYGIEKITESVMQEIRNERRILFHAMMSVNASYFSLGKTEGECWHFNFGNERGGRQFDVLPGGGGASHSLLKNVRDKQTGKITACWTNEVAHQMYDELMK